MAVIHERNVPFTQVQMEQIKKIAIDENRSFKYQAAELIKEALEAREAK